MTESSGNGKRENFWSVRMSMLSGKRVAFVTAGYPGKRFIYERARELGVFVIILDSKCSWSRDVADEFVEIDLKSPSLIPDCITKLNSLAIDGICTFSEIALEITAKLAACLNLPGLPEVSVAVARNKHLTRKALGNVKSALIKAVSDLPFAAEIVGFPAVLKPVAGADSLGVRKIHDFSDLSLAYSEICSELKQLIISSGALTRSSDPDSPIPADDVISDHLVLEEFIEGPEVDVDVVLDSTGVVKYLAISDNGPTLEPYFTETWAVAPSLLPQDAQQSLALLAVDSIKRLGFEGGIFHVEARLHHGIAKLIEVNCRMGGGPIYHMHKKIFNRDLVEDQISLTCGVEFSSCGGPDAVRGKGGFAYITPTAPRSGRWEGPEGFFEKYRRREGVFMVFEYVKRGEFVRGPDRGQPEWIGEIVVWSEKEGADWALRRAQELAQELVDDFIGFLI